MEISKKSFGSGRQSIVVTVPDLPDLNFTYINSVFRRGFVYDGRPYEHYGWQPDYWIEDTFSKYFNTDTVSESILIPYTHRWRGKNVNGYFFFLVRTDVKRDRPSLSDTVADLSSDGDTFDVDVYRLVRGTKTVGKRKSTGSRRVKTRSSKDYDSTLGGMR